MENSSLWTLGHQITPIPVSGDFDMVTGVTPPRVAGPPPHHHSMYNEMFMVLEGEMEFIVDGNPVKLEKGCTIDLPVNTVHTFANNSEFPCKWINVHSPKGFLKFFQTFGIPDSVIEAQSMSVSEEVIRKVMREAAGCDMLIDM
jgi:mannose-6-phosphate isomerase-like protein (cupin superfamily)